MGFDTGFDGNPRSKTYLIKKIIEINDWEKVCSHVRLWVCRKLSSEIFGVFQTCRKWTTCFFLGGKFKLGKLGETWEKPTFFRQIRWLGRNQAFGNEPLARPYINAANIPGLIEEVSYVVSCPQFWVLTESLLGSSRGKSGCFKNARLLGIHKFMKIHGLDIRQFMSTSLTRGFQIFSLSFAWGGSLSSSIPLSFLAFWRRRIGIGIAPCFCQGLNTRCRALWCTSGTWFLNWNLLPLLASQRAFSVFSSWVAFCT